MTPYDLDLPLLKLFLEKKKYEEWATLVDDNTLLDETKIILKDISKYYEDHSSVEHINLTEFVDYFFNSRHRDLLPKQQEPYKLIFENIGRAEVKSPKFLLKRLREEHLIQQFIEGKQRGLPIDKLKDALLKYEEEVEVEDPSIKWDVPSLYKELDRSNGLKFRLTKLNEAIDPLKPGDFLLVGAYVETGKCLGKGTKVIMADGTIKLVEDIKVGDLLMGDDSSPRTVLSLARGKAQMYKIHQGNGDDYIVNNDHILSLKYCDSNKKFSNIEPYSILDIAVEDFLALPASSRAYFKGFKVGVDFNPQAVPIDPYLLGTWLGDGTSTNGSITSMSPEIINYWDSMASRFNCTLKDLHTKNTGKASTYRLRKRSGTHNLFMDKLKELNVLNNKHIPSLYLHNSFEVREALLAGLLDTDGSFNSDSHYYEITQKRKDLADNIVYLARSLGLFTTLTSKIVNQKTYYRIYISGTTAHLPLLRLPTYQSAAPKRKGLHYKIEIEKLGIDDYYGFTLDGNKRFLLGDFTVTHNTTFLSSEITYMAQQLKDDPRPILWFNNEGLTKRIINLHLCSLFGRTKQQIEDNKDKADDAYLKLLGSHNKIKFYDAHRKDYRFIEKICKKENPALIIIDQMDYVKGFSNKQLQIGYQELYSWARELSCLYCPLIGVTQASSTARYYNKDTQEREAKRYLDLSEMHFSQVDKPGAAEIVILIGSHSEAPKVRYIHVCKNKNTGKHLKFECNFKQEIGRYED